MAIPASQSCFVFLWSLDDDSTDDRLKKLFKDIGTFTLEEQSKIMKLGAIQKQKLLSQLE